MSSQAALFKILFQNDTLFQLNESKPVVVQEKESPVAKSAPIAPQQPKPAPTTIKIAEKPEAPKLVSAPVAQEFPALKHRILILTEDQKQQEMQAAEAVFLDNILKAVKFSISEADVFNVSFLPPTDARGVISGRKINYFITFGVPLVKLNVDLLLIPYTPKLVDGIWFLLADPLAAIESDRDLKRKLWQALQKMFEKA
ncbi:hypothetical protein [Dyadobacter sp. CY312]|uniref:hypothetical protein n=1 Tax=Dyadobacter sp. CY312 TaxID=2907303 RepID=UPI001F33FD13|nr:hypothetical protein [Dyadobacter sp. CY312]MCE7041934.1 hypothetical protein [Dyadobacter sp. CY312]